MYSWLLRPAPGTARTKPGGWCLMPLPRRCARTAPRPVPCHRQVWRSFRHGSRKRSGGQWIEDTPKSVKSTRRVPLPGWLAERMADYLRDHPHADDPAAPLFPGKYKGGHTHGKRTPGSRPARSANWAEPIEPTLFYKNVLKPALLAAGLPASTPARGDRPAEAGVRLHDLRHTFATMALDDGHDYREVSEWLGHADYATTLRVYAHWIPDTRENTMSAPPVPAAGGNVIPLAERRRSAG